MLTVFGAFLKDRSGQISIIFALMSVPLMLAVGAAIDRIRMDPLARTTASTAATI